MKLNPYIAGNPVGGGDAFIGRTDVLREVVRVQVNLLTRKEKEQLGQVIQGPCKYWVRGLRPWSKHLPKGWATACLVHHNPKPAMIFVSATEIQFGE